MNPFFKSTKSEVDRLSSGSLTFGILCVCSLLLLWVTPLNSMAQDGSLITTNNAEGRFPLSVKGVSTPLVISGQDHGGAIRALKDLREDIGRVTGNEPAVSEGSIPEADHMVIAGTIGNSPLIDKLIESSKIDVSEIKGNWESTLIQVVERPLPDVKQALIIAGSDKRGTIYGLHEISEQIGVSPWHFWADVPPKQKSQLYVVPERHRLGEPDGNSVTVQAMVKNPQTPDPEEYDGFVAANGYISMGAEQYSNRVETSAVNWQLVSNLGRTKSAITPLPVTAESQNSGNNSQRLEYKVYLPETGEIEVRTHLSPTLNFLDNQGLRYGISIDDGPVKIINMHSDESHPQWQEWARNNLYLQTSTHQISEPGEHTFKFWMVDPGVALQKIVIDAGGLQPGYLGSPAMKSGVNQHVYRWNSIKYSPLKFLFASLSGRTQVQR